MRSTIPVRTPFWLGAAVLVLLLASPPKLLAHAILVRSTPADGAVVHTRNVAFTLDYDSRIDAPLCVLTLRGPKGKDVDLQRQSSAKPNELKARASGLVAGIYHIHWQALASDGHITRGEIAFTVAPAKNPAN